MRNGGNRMIHRIIDLTATIMAAATVPVYVAGTLNPLGLMVAGLVIIGTRR